MNMKLSDLIEEGAKQVEFARGALAYSRYDGEEYCCALGAACIGAGVPFEDLLQRYTTAKATQKVAEVLGIPLLKDEEGEYCGEAALLRDIVLYNDGEARSFEDVLQWLRAKGQ
jgi:hypothetical protein